MGYDIRLAILCCFAPIVHPKVAAFASNGTPVRLFVGVFHSEPQRVNLIVPVM